MKRRRLVATAVIVACLGATAIVWKRARTAARSSAVTMGTAERLAASHAARRGAGPEQQKGSIAGSVARKADGIGVTGAVVVLKRTDKGADDEEDREPVPTDERGAWLASGLAPGKYDVAATAPGFLPATQSDVEVKPGRDTSCELLLETGGSLLSGTVTDFGGGPIGGAFVAVSGKAGRVGTLTADDGTYQVSLRDGEYDVLVAHQDYIEADSRSFELRGAAHTEDWKLVPGGTISGRVVSRQGHTPVAGAKVTSVGDGNGITPWEVRRYAVADAEGRFMLTGVSSGTHQVSAEARGQASREPAVVELGIGEQASDVEVVVDQGFVISGFVVERRDERVGLADVGVGAMELTSHHYVGHISSGADGFFEVAVGTPGRYSLGVMGGGVVANLFAKEVTVGDRDVTNVLLVVDKGAILSGRVEPPGEATVRLDSRAELGLFAVASSMLNRAGTESDADGAFRLEGAAPGQFFLVATTDDGRKGKLAVDVSGADQSGLVITLEERGAIAGRVVDTGGRPVGGVAVKAVSGEVSLSFRMPAASSSSDGAFRLVGLDPGKYRVTVERRRQQLAWADAAHRDEPRKPIEVVVEGKRTTDGVVLVVGEQNGVIRGVVEGEGGRPVADAWVTAALRPSGDGSVRYKGIYFERLRKEPPVLTGADGRFAFANLVDGTYDVTAELAKGTARGRKEGVRTGDNVTISLDALAAIQGVVTSGGTPVKSFRLKVDGPSERQRTVVAEDGRYRADHLDPGKYEVSVTCDAGSAQGEVEVAAGAIATLDLVIAGWGSVTGTVVDGATGKPMTGLVVLGYSSGDQDGGDFMDAIRGGGPRTDENGRFRLGKLGPGEGAVAIMAAGAKDPAPIAVKHFTLAAGQTLDVGTLYALAPKKSDKQGDLGFTAEARTWATRPGARPGPPPVGLIPDETCLWVDEVVAGSPAGLAGMRQGDRIFAVDGKTVARYGASVVDALIYNDRVNLGQVVPISLERDGKAFEVTLTAVEPKD